MPVLVGPVLDLTQAAIASGCAFALAMVCLIQYVHQLASQARQSRLTEQFRREVDQLSAEMLQLNRERLCQRLENQILREVLAQTDCRRAIQALLKRFAINPEDSFAAFVLTDSSSEALPQARGLSDESLQSLLIPSDVMQHLTRHGAQVWDAPTPGNCSLIAALSPTDRRKIHELAALACGDDQGLLGVLLTTSLLPIAASREDQIELSRRLLGVVAPNLRQTLELERQASQLQCTREMLELRSITDTKFDQPNRMLERFLTRLGQMLSAERVGLYLLSRDGSHAPKATVRCGIQLQPGVMEAWLDFEDRLANFSVDAGCLLAYDVRQLQQIEIHSLIGSAISAPLITNGAVIGTICMTRRCADRPSAAQRQLIAWSAETLSHTIHRVLSIVAIEKQARLDGLTQLANRRTFDTQLDAEISRLRDGSQVEFSLLLLDIDRFKSINDTYGHQAGDEVLRCTAQLLREHQSQMRADEGALLARYGGEEMAILLPGVGVNGACRIAESIRQTVEKQTVRCNGAAIRVTVSIGVATCPLHAHTSEEALAVADAGLYQAKSSGRNRVISPADILQTVGVH